MINTFAAQNGDLIIAVGATVRTLGYCGNDPGCVNGKEYTLGGVPTGSTYGMFPGCCGNDGTTDGTHNYSVNYTVGGPGVTQFTSTWTSPVALGFATGGQLGITYDPTDNTLWTSCYLCNLGIQHWSLGGAPLGGFAAPTADSASGADHRFALALDHADNTLWSYNSLSNTMEHWTKTGVHLGDDFIFTGSELAHGAEFALVPEPTTLGLFGLALIGLAGMAARRQRSR